MNKDDILNLVSNLACSQGFYGRLLCDLQEDEGFLQYLADKNFESEIDFICYIEGC